jgi:two-component system, chemotaxis family, CheB/CheR fusion protein
MDLISCRNLLIYFDNKLQNKLISLFHYSLKPDGILFLGPSESLGDCANFFPYSIKNGIFLKVRENLLLSIGFPLKKNQWRCIPPC